MLQFKLIIAQLLSSYSKKEMSILLYKMAIVLKLLEMPASRVFLVADAQVLGTSLVGSRSPLSLHLKSLLKLNIRSSASPCLAP